MELPMPRIDHCERLERRAREIVEALSGHWGRAKGMCCCPAHDDRTPSLSVSSAARQSSFTVLQVVRMKRSSRHLARAGVRAHDCSMGRREPLPPAVRDDFPDRNACRLWREAPPRSAGSPAERYLAGRAIAARSPDLRYHLATPLGPSGSVRFLPAMLAAVRTDLGIVAVHRTFLDADEPDARCLRRPEARLGQSATRCGPAGLPRGGRLGLAEGIETALSAMQLFGVPCWATLGNERFGLVTIPESVRELHLFVDHDAGGVLAEDRARETYQAKGDG